MTSEERCFLYRLLDDYLTVIRDRSRGSPGDAREEIVHFIERISNHRDRMKSAIDIAIERLSRPLGWSMDEALAHLQRAAEQTEPGTLMDIDDSVEGMIRIRDALMQQVVAAMRIPREILEDGVHPTLMYDQIHDDVIFTARKRSPVRRRILNLPNGGEL